MKLDEKVSLHHLADAIRKDQLMVAGSRKDGTVQPFRSPETEALVELMRGRSWAMPSYDFRPLADQVLATPADVQRIYEMGVEALGPDKRQWPLPHDQFAVVHGAPDMDYSWVMVVTKYEHAPDAAIGMLESGGRFGKDLIESLRNGKKGDANIVFIAEIFLKTPQRWLHYGYSRYKNDDFNFLQIPIDPLEPGDSRHDDLQRLDRAWDQYIVMSLFILSLGSEAQVKTETAPATLTARMTNDRLTKARMPTIPPAKRILYVALDAAGQVAKVRKAHRGGTHASPRPHERRAHYRTYKSGKRVRIEAMPINGFKREEASIPPTTEVRVRPHQE